VGSIFTPSPTGNPEEPEYGYEALLNAIPMPVFIVDADLVVNNINTAAVDVFNLHKRSVLYDRWGSALNCVHSGDDPGGCGLGAECKNCNIRNSIAESFNGLPIIQRKTRIALNTVGFEAGSELLITVNQIMDSKQILALFMIEDMTKLSLVNMTVPICMHCKKLRESDNQWSNLDDYFDHNLHIKFSHCICESCLGKYYPDIATKNSTNH
jgi:hypothetical protein